MSLPLLTILAAALLAQPAQPETDDTHYRAGIGLLKKGLDDAAATELRASLKDHPDGPDATNARYALAVCLWRLRRPAEAAAELDKLLPTKEFEFAADARLLRARCAQAAGDDAGVLKALESLAADHPGFDKLDQSALCLAEAQYRLGRYKECRDTLSPLAGSTDAPARPVLFLAMAQAALGDSGKAAELAARVLAASPTGELAPNAALLEAQCRHRLGDVAKAEPLYERASRLAKDSLRAEALLGLAQLARGAGDLPKAERSLREAAGGTPAGDLGDQLALERAKLLLDQAKASEASALLTTLADRTSPRIAAEVALWSARAELALGRPADAARTLTAAAERASTPADLAPELLFDLPGALGKGGDHKAALAAWDRWLEKFPKHPLRLDAYTARAWCLFRLGRHEDCRKLCAALFKNSATPSDSLRLLAAENEFAAGKYAEALAAYTALDAAAAGGPAKAPGAPGAAYARRAAIRRGLCQQALGKNAEAARTLESALTVGSADPDLDRAAALALGELAFAAEDWAGAQRRFEAIAKDASAGDTALDAALRAAVCLARQGKPAEALPHLDRLLAAPGSPRACHAAYEKAQALAALDRPAEAEPLLKALLADPACASSSPGLIAPARRLLARQAVRQGRPDEAAALLAGPGATPQDTLDAGLALLAAQKLVEAERTLAPLTKSDDPGLATAAWIHLAIAINRQGRAAEALPLLDRTLPPGTPADQRSAAIYERALALRTLNKPDKSADALRVLLAPGSVAGTLEPYAALDLSEIERDAGHHAESLTLADRALTSAAALKVAALVPRATYVRAAAQLALKQPAEAATTLKAFASSFPASELAPAAAFLRGEALLAASPPRAVEATEEFARAAEPKSPPALRAPALLRLGEAHTAAQKWKDAEGAFSAFLDAFPDHDQWFRARFGQAYARENQGRHEDALSAYREVAARHKGATAARAQFQIGECLYAMKKLEQAVAEFAKTDVLFAVPEWSAAALYEAGRCLDELKKPEDAARQFDDLIARFPGTSWAKLAKERKPPKEASASLPGR